MLLKIFFPDTTFIFPILSLSIYAQSYLFSFLCCVTNFTCNSNYSAGSCRCNSDPKHVNTDDEDLKICGPKKTNLMTGYIFGYSRIGDLISCGCWGRLLVKMISPRVHVAVCINPFIQILRIYSHRHKMLLAVCKTFFPSSELEVFLIFVLLAS